MAEDISRAFKYASDFYFQRLGLIVLFSVPFVFAFLIPILVPAPTYLALGGVFLRTGSIPELSLLDLAITVAAYALAMFLISDTIVNINIIIRSKRTMTTIKQDILAAMGTYALRIFFINTAVLVCLFFAQLLTYDNPFQSILYPLFSFLLTFFLFFVPPAVVIDNSGIPDAITRSVWMVGKNPHLVLIWALLSIFSLSLAKVFGDFVFSGAFSSYFVLLLNSLVMLPYLIVLQTQMYMEKYPLAR